jgi:hypothetical protein
MKSDTVTVAGILHNLTSIGDSGGVLEEYRNSYIGEIISLSDYNTLPIVIVEKDFCPLTSILIG